ncbi:hypothetical protein P152DRAFT_254407 [Eremomyces bilateralis CBS 781.70]|uniref:Inhibitor I9 domain-containing protein n=1 Tax=Eremomyces bilateralis CBS 781.70 TaxID=1392243 RepID=A0A6G1FR54_9PEZI|nr:uncharacterized protein P152DRAFT_254407 [Eremomyces bilateralis CBS 781.70]KAF1808161.1 hypothetical protein P152DRAFT_254407 [Eremomyces bilateralis CBS 781.70]
MSTVIITLKSGVDANELEKVKNDIRDQGGEITHESKLIKSIHAKFPTDKVHTLATNENWTVEADQEVRTQ